MALGLLVIAVIGVLLFNFFSGREKPGVPPEEVNTEELKEEQAAPVSLPTKHTVASGENLWSIAEKYFNSGYNWVDIARENELINPDYLETDQVLNIPKTEPILPATGTGTAVSSTLAPITESNYTVVQGDNLWDIAVRAYGDGFKWVEIAKANNLVNPDFIHSENVLTLPR